MQSKARPLTQADLRADRGVQLKELIEAGIAGSVGSDCADAGRIVLVARGPESIAFQSVFALSGLLALRGIEARVILMAGDAGEQWNLEFAPGFRHEIRIGADPRLLDAHEQLVVGDIVWFGDNMRREPERRDAFCQTLRNRADAGLQSRRTFGQLWDRCRPLYRHEAGVSPAAVSVAADACDAALAQDVLATLEAWQPPSSH